MDIVFHTRSFLGIPDDESFTIQVNEEETFEALLARLLEKLLDRFPEMPSVDVFDLEITTARDDTIDTAFYADLAASIVSAFGSVFHVGHAAPSRPGPAHPSPSPVHPSPPSVMTGHGGMPSPVQGGLPGIAAPAASSDGPVPTPPHRDKDMEKKKRMHEKAIPVSLDETAARPGELEGEREETKQSQVTSVSAITQAETAASTRDKNVAAEYFDVMNPDNYYPLVIEISDRDIEKIRTQENILTGERKVQKQDEFQFDVEDPVIIVRPVFPGCTVAPLELPTNLDDPSDKLTFFVTPLVHGEIHGQVDFCSGGVVIQRMALPAKVKDPRHARVVALYGIIASLVPRIGDFLGVDLGSSIQASDVLPFLGAILANLSLANFIAIAGMIVAGIIGVIYYVRQKPEQSSIQYRLTDFRLAALDRPRRH